MSNQIISYDFHKSNIRAITSENGVILFCLANQIKNEFELPKLNLASFDTGYGVKEFTMITESQLYFVMMRSRAKVAREFRQWICNEVLPSRGYTLAQFARLKDKELKKLNDQIKELAYEKKEQESSLNLTITCLKDELRKTEAARGCSTIRYHSRLLSCVLRTRLALRPYRLMCDLTGSRNVEK